jgi:hypothetical protein
MTDRDLGFGGVRGRQTMQILSIPDPILVGSNPSLFHLAGDELAATSGVHIRFLISAPAS